MRCAWLVLALSSFPAIAGAQSAAPKPPHPAARWFDVQTATISTRFRVIETSAGEVTTKQQQHQEQLRFAVKFDPQGRYRLNMGLASGTSFISGWSNTGIGRPSTGQWAVYAKQFFFSAAPATGLEFQVGGLSLLRGDNTEITSYDIDGYVAGERIDLKRPADLFLDEVAFTAGHLGDTTTPNAFRRFKHMNDTNYWQALAGKKLGPSATMSTDLTSVDGVRTVRAAVTVKSKQLRVVDLVRFENYRRFGDSPAYGFAAYGERGVTKAITVGAGWADIDRFYGGLNADRFNIGRRVYLTSQFALVNGLGLLMFYQHGVHNAFATTNNVRFEIVLTWNVKQTLTPYFK